MHFFRSLSDPSQVATLWPSHIDSWLESKDDLKPSEFLSYLLPEAAEGETPVLLPKAGMLHGKQVNASKRRTHHLNQFLCFLFLTGRAQRAVDAQKAVTTLLRLVRKFHFNDAF